MRNKLTVPDLPAESRGFELLSTTYLESSLEQMVERGVAFDDTSRVAVAIPF